MTRPVLVLADIHGNLEALKAVLSHAAGKFEEIWSLGDVAGYGPDPGPCLDILRKMKTVMVAGNHDLAACGKLDTEDFNREARAAVELHRAVLSAEHQRFLAELPLIRERRSVTLSHGNPADPVWGYVLNLFDAARVLSTAQTSLTLVGHTHLPGLWALAPSGRVVMPEAEYEAEYSYAGGLHLANPGSVGQSRDGDPSARYMLLHPERKTLAFHSCRWKTGPTRRKMAARGYPKSLIERMAPRN